MNAWRWSGVGGLATAVIAASAVVAAACGGSEVAPPAKACSPGQSVACIGAGGCAGGQTCKSDGSGYDTCSCGTTPPGDGGGGGGAEGGSVDASSPDTSVPDAAPACGDAPFAALSKSLGAIAYFSMDDLGTTFVDSIGGYNGTVGGTLTQGAAGLVSGGKAASFSGNGYVRVPYVAALQPSAFTTIVWMQVGDTSTFRTPVSTRGVSSNDCQGYTIETHTGGLVFGTWGNGCNNGGWKTAAGPALVPGNTYMVALAYDPVSSTGSLYVNGSLTGTGVGARTATTEPFDIGQIANGSQRFIGTIDDVAVFNRALSAAEIAKLYSTGSCK